MVRFTTCWLATLLMATLLQGADEPATYPLDEPLQARCVRILEAGLASEEFWPAMHAAEALTLAGHNVKVLDALAQRKVNDDQQRCGIARERVRAGDRSGIPVLLGILSKQGSNGHTHAAESLFKIAEVGDGEALRAAYAQQENPRLRLMAAAALARSGHPTALEAPRQALTHADVEIRKIGAWILGQLGTPADREPLSRQWPQETDPLAKAYFAHALALLQDAAGKKALLANLGSDDAAIRTYASEFAGYCRLAEARPILIERLDDPNLDVRIRAAQSLIAMSLPGWALGLPRAQSEMVNVQDLFPASAENPRYSEGSILALKDGTLMYATTEFIGGARDESRARIVARYSQDQGRTWSPARVVQENIGSQNVMSVTLRRLRPHAVDGPIGLFFLIKNGPADLKVILRVSHDEGKTFGDQITVTQQPGYHVMNNDRVSVLSSGRLICPIAWCPDIAQPGGMHFICQCFYSDDQGKTWAKSANEIDAPRRGAMEPEVLELKSGHLLMIIRTQLGKITTARSEDGGVHWKEGKPLPVQSPESPATIRRIPATGDLLLVWNNTTQRQRTPLTAAISRDEGETWAFIRNLENDPKRAYAYTSVLFHRGRAHFSYYISEPGTNRLSSRYRSLPVHWLYASE